eukprot:243224_1
MRKRTEHKNRDQKTMAELLTDMNCLGIKHIVEENYLLPPDSGILESRKWLKANYKPTDNEVWVVTYPKTGTTLALQILHAIMECHYNETKCKNDEYYKDNTRLYTNVEWIDLLRQSPSKFNRFISSTKNTKRFWKTHSRLDRLPCTQLPQKMIIVCRNPKDALVSFYHHTKNAKTTNSYDYKDDFDTFFTLYCSGLVENNSYFEYYRQYWKFYMQSQRKDVDVLWLNYEDLVVNESSKRAQIVRLIEFIGMKDMVYSEQHLDAIVKNTSMEKMKYQYNESKKSEPFGIKNFVRKGVIGDWKNYFNEKQNEIMNALIKVYFNGTKFRYFVDLRDGKDYLSLQTLIQSKL